MSDEQNVSEAVASQTPVESSVKVILENQTANGAYPACPHFKVYEYCWFRDGSFIADAISRAGQTASAERFFDWCAGVILARRNTINSGGRLDARYTYEGQESQDDWAAFQLDGYGTWLWALKNHEQRHNLRLQQYDEAVALTAQYLSVHWQEPCTDWWEERTGLHAANLASMYAGMAAIGSPEAAQIQQAIQLDTERTDASLLACLFFKAVTPGAFEATLKQIETQLISPSGGVYRYRDDNYYGGGEWLLLTAMLGWCYAELGRLDEARDKLRWVAARAGDHGWMPEQSGENILHPDSLQHWHDTWGAPATPLLWSHAMFITLYSVLNSK